MRSLVVVIAALTGCLSAAPPDDHVSPGEDTKAGQAAEGSFVAGGRDGSGGAAADASAAGCSEPGDLVAEDVVVTAAEARSGSFDVPGACAVRIVVGSGLNAAEFEVVVRGPGDVEVAVSSENMVSVSPGGGAAEGSIPAGPGGPFQWTAEAGGVASFRLTISTT